MGRRGDEKPGDREPFCSLAVSPRGRVPYRLILFDACAVWPPTWVAQPELPDILICRLHDIGSRAAGKRRRSDADVIDEPALIAVKHAGRFVKARLETELDALADEVVEVDDHLTEDACLAARRPRETAAERVA